MAGTLVRYKDSSSQCWSRVDTTSGDNIWISVARSGVVVKNSNVGLFGRKLYDCSDVDVITRHSMNIDAFLVPSIRNRFFQVGMKDEVFEIMSEIRNAYNLPPDLQSPILASFTAIALNTYSVGTLETFFRTPELSMDTSYWVRHLQRSGM